MGEFTQVMKAIEPQSKFVRLVYWAAGIYGLIVVRPIYFLEDQRAKQTPPAIAHGNFDYGFAMGTLAWQLVYLVVANDPMRYRRRMLLGASGNASNATAGVVLLRICKIFLP